MKEVYKRTEKTVEDLVNRLREQYEEAAEAYDRMRTVYEDADARYRRIVWVSEYGSMSLEVKILSSEDPVSYLSDESFVYDYLQERVNHENRLMCYGEWEIHPVCSVRWERYYFEEQPPHDIVSIWRRVKAHYPYAWIVRRFDTEDGPHGPGIVIESPFSEAKFVLYHQHV